MLWFLLVFLWYFLILNYKGERGKSGSEACGQGGIASDRYFLWLDGMTGLEIWNYSWEGIGEVSVGNSGKLSTSLMQ